RQRLLGLLDLQRLVQVTVVGAARAAEDHVFLVAVDVVREAQARLPLVLGLAAVVAGADVVGDVDAAHGQGLGVGLPRRRIGILRVERRDDVGRGNEVEVRRRLLVIPADAEVQGQVVVDRPVVLDVGAVLLVRAGRDRTLPRRRRAELHLVRNAFG